ncbi:MAG TPA: histidinol dehydrogenase, partial [Nitrospirae bacterium]|nr:histidinol dehydrogenase [Nitrospirota bacterium]
LALRVSEEVKRQIKTLGRREIAEASLKNFGAIIVTRTLGKAVRVANLIAPEHLEIMTEKPEKLLPQIQNAGAIFLGKWTPEALGDYAAGPNHTLPTGGTARFFSPLGVYDFVKRSSLLSFSRQSFQRLSSVVETLSDLEGLEAHGRAVKVRKGISEESNR